MTGRCRSYEKMSMPRQTLVLDPEDLGNDGNNNGGASGSGPLSSDEEWQRICE